MPKTYETYLTKGHFDFLYDKVGLYDGLRRLMRQEGTHRRYYARLENGEPRLRLAHAALSGKP